MTEISCPLNFSQKHVDSTGMVLHGFLGSHKSMEELASYLDSSYILPDLIGHGSSPCPTELKQYTLKAMINQIHEVANSSLQEPFDLIGYSMGGRLALSYALAKQNNLRSLILIGGSPGIEDDFARHQRAIDDIRKAALLEDKGLPAFVNAWETQRIFSSQRLLSSDKLFAQRRARLSTKPMGIISHLRASGAGVMRPLWGRLHEIKIPVLLVVGSKDEKYIDIGGRMRSRIPSSALAMVSGAGHAVHFEKPEETAEVINKFTQGL
tara:strand:- start:3969 stop:4766 length:798 start_codon:yes stop_codon:yes gene_type:complete